MENEIAAIISYALLGVLGLFAVISLLIGLKKGLKKALGSTVVIVLSAIIAFIITSLAFNPNSSLLQSGADALTGLMQDTEIADILALDSASGAVSTYACMLMSPFIFVLLFLVIRIVLGIAMWICIRFIPVFNPPVKEKKKKKNKKKAAEASTSAETAEVTPAAETGDGSQADKKKDRSNGYCPVTKPVNRLVGMGVGIVNGIILCLIFLMPLLGTLGVVSDAMDEMEKNGIVSSSDMEDVEFIGTTVHEGTGGFMYSCSKFMYNGLTSTKYNGEKVCLKNEVSVILSMVNNFSSTDGENDIVVAVDAVYDGVDRSPIIRSFAAELVAKMSEAWLNGDAFMGMSKPELDEIIDPTIDALLEIFASETDKTITADLESIKNFLEVADKNNMLSGELNTDELIEKFSKKGIFEDLIHTLDGNERMVTVVDEVNYLAVRIFASELDMPQNKDEIYDNLIADIDGVMESYRNGYIDRAEAKKNILNTLERYAIGPSTEDADRFAENLLDGAVSSNDVVESRSNLKSSMITSEDLLGYIGKYSDVDDKNAEAGRIDDVMASLVSVLDNIDLNSESIHAADIMSQMGETLDKMAETDTYGNATDKLLIAVMQSNKISDSIGLSVYEMTDFANKIIDGRKNGTGYKEISSTLSHSFNVLENIDNTTTNTKKENIEAILKNITPETAEVVKNIATPSLMKNYGVKDEHADKASNAVGSLFGNIADFRNDFPDATEEDEQHEVEAVNQIITIAVKATKDDSHTNQYFNSKSGDGHLDMSAYEVVDLFATSTVASETLEDILTEENDDPMGIHNGINNADKEELKSALEQYSEENTGNGEIQERLNNIGSMFGVDFKN